MKTFYVCLPPKNVAELKPWDIVHVYLIGPYINYIRQHQTGRATTKNDVSLTYMTIIDPDMGWF